MIRRSRMNALLSVLVACAAVLPLAPRSLAAQVGYPPAASPYQDLQGKQGIAFSAGLMVPGGDPAGVGPRTGLMFTGRYELLLSGPLWLVSRVGYAPGLERTVKDPEDNVGSRVVGTETEPLYLMDIGFGLNLTGNKSWRRIAPRATVALGAVSTLKSAYDLGGYRFGSKFVFSYGVGARVVTGSAWELNADLSHMFWKMSYPASYGGTGAPDDLSILRDGPLGPWKGNLLMTVGITRYFFR